jgi:hypothetical protein
VAVDDTESITRAELARAIRQALEPIAGDLRALRETAERLMATPRADVLVGTKAILGELELLLGTRPGERSIRRWRETRQMPVYTGPTGLLTASRVALREWARRWTRKPLVRRGG